MWRKFNMACSKPKTKNGAYRIYPKLGIALLVNNLHSTSPGSQLDIQALENSYREMGFEVHIYNDCNDKKMRELRKWIGDPALHKDSSMVIVNVIAHGTDAGFLRSKDGLGWHTDDIIGTLTDVDTLSGKPIIMFINACRGVQIPQPVEVDQNPGVKKAIKLADPNGSYYVAMHPKGADVFLGFATRCGQISTMMESRGSIFMQTLAEYLITKYHEMHLEEMYLAVTDIVAQSFFKVNSDDNEIRDFMQIPEKISTLRKHLYFTANPSDPPSVKEVEQRKTIQTLENQIEKIKGENDKQAKEIRELHRDLQKATIQWSVRRRHKSEGSILQGNRSEI